MGHVGYNRWGMWDSGMERGGGGMERVVAVRVGRWCGQHVSVGGKHVEGRGYALWRLACRWGLWVHNGGQFLKPGGTGAGGAMQKASGCSYGWWQHVL